MNNESDQEFLNNLENLQNMILQTLKLQCEIVAMVNALKTDYVYQKMGE